MSIDPGSNPRSGERRRFPRVPCRGAAEVFLGTRRAVWGTATDLSRGGCYIETAQPLPIGTRVKLRLTFGDIPLSIEARITTSHPQVGMGMAFLAGDPSQQETLATILDNVAGIRRPPAAAASASPAAANPSPAAAHTLRIPNQEAPFILNQVIQVLNKKGTLTRQDFMVIVKARLNPTEP